MIKYFFRRITKAVCIISFLCIAAHSHGAKSDLPFKPTVNLAKEVIAKCHPKTLIYDEGYGDYRKFADLYKVVSSDEAKDDAESLRLRGLMILNGHVKGIPQKAALPFLEKAASLGDSLAMSRLAKIYLRGLLVECDFDKAKEYSDKAIALKQPRGYDVKITLHKFGLGVERSEKKVEALSQARHEMYLKLYEEKDYMGWLGLAREMTSGSKLYDDYQSAKLICTSLGNAGSIVALTGRAGCHGLQKKYDMALKVGEKALKKGSLPAAFLFLHFSSSEKIFSDPELQKIFENCYQNGGYVEQLPKAIVTLKRPSGGRAAAKPWVADVLMKASKAGDDRFVSKYLNIIGDEGIDAWGQQKQIAWIRAALLSGSGNEETYLMALITRLLETEIEACFEEAQMWAAYSKHCGIEDGDLLVQILAQKRGKDVAKYEKYLLSLLKKGNEDAAIFLGQLYDPNYRDDSKHADLNKAVKYYTLASKNHPSAFSLLGGLFDDSDRDRSDLKKALSYYLQGAENKDPESLRMLAHFYLTSDGEWYRKANEAVGGADVAKAIQYLKDATAAGNGAAAESLASIYRDGVEGQEASLEKAFLWFQKAADLDDAYSLAELASFYDPHKMFSKKNIVAGGADVGLAMKYYLRASKKKNGWACSRLARLYLNGYANGGKDLKKAYSWFERGKRLGNASSIALAGSFYDPHEEYSDWNKVVGGAEASKAISYYKLAAKQEDGWACFRLAKIYLNGFAPSGKDLKQSYAWFEKGHDLGNSDSTAMLASFYLPFDQPWAKERNTMVGGADATKALVLSKQAANQGDSWAAVNIAELHRFKHLGEASSFEEAEKYYRLSGETGRPSSYNDLAWMLIDDKKDYHGALKAFERGIELGDWEYCGISRGELFYHGSAETNPLYDPKKAVSILQEFIEKSDDYDWFCKQCIADLYRTGKHPDGKNHKKAQELYLEIHKESEDAKKWADSYPNWDNEKNETKE